MLEMMLNLIELTLSNACSPRLDAPEDCGSVLAFSHLEQISVD
jgi:hypothetical protein